MFSILKDSIIYLIAIYGSRLFSFIYKIIIARILGPRDYGVWNLLTLILLYGSFLHLGLVYALVKEVSFYRGKEEWNEIDEIKNTVFSSVIIIATVAAIILFIPAIFFNLYENNLLVFFLISVILILQQIRNYFLSIFFAEKKFATISKLIILSSLLVGVPAVIFVLKFGLVGLLLGITVGNFLVLLYIINKYKPIPKFKVNKKKFFSLLKIGFPIMLILLSYNIFITFDRVLIFKYIGKINLGYYSIASTLTGFMVLLPASLGIIFFPLLSEKYGFVGEINKLKEFIYTPTIILAYFIPILLGLIYLALPTAVKILVPQYIPGVNAGRIALIGTMFLSVSIFAQKFLVVINRQLDCLFIALSAIVLKTILTYIFISKHMGIEGVALAGNIVYFVYGVFIIMYASYRCMNNFLESVKYLIKIYLPFLYLLLILFGLSYFKKMTILNINSEIIHTFINLIILSILVITPFVYVIRKNLFSYLKYILSR